MAFARSPNRENNFSCANSLCGYLLLLVLVFQASAVSSQKVARQFKCPQQFGYFQDMSDCNKYFICVFGDALHDKCTPGLYFNNELRMCDWPRNVKGCDGGVVDASQELTARKQFGTSTARPRQQAVDRSSSSSINNKVRNEEIPNINSITPPKPTQDTRAGRRYTPPINGQPYIATSRNATHVHFRPPSNLYTKMESTTTASANPVTSSHLNAPGSFKPIYIRITPKSPALQRSSASSNKRKDYDDESDYYDDDDYEEDESDEPKLILNRNLRLNNNNVYVTPIDPKTSQKPRLLQYNYNRGPTTKVYPTLSTYYTRTNMITRPRPAANTSYLLLNRVQPGGYTSFNLRGRQVNTNVLSDSSSSEENTSSYDSGNSRQEDSSERPSNFRGPPYMQQMDQRPKTTPYSIMPVTYTVRPRDVVPVIRARPQVSRSNSIDNQKDSLDAQFGTNPRAISLPDAPYRQNSFLTNSDEKKAEKSQQHNKKPIVQPPPKYLPPPRLAYKPESNEGFDDYPEYYYDDDEYYDDEEEDEPGRPKVVIRVQTPKTATTYKPTTPSVTTRRPSTKRPATTKAAKRPLPFGISRPATKRPITFGPRPLPRLPSRPAPLYATPRPLQLAEKCSSQKCFLPDCRCGVADIPGGLSAHQVPQIVLITFDDAVNDLNYELYSDIFEGRTNPNGCPILGTFYVSHEWTDYGMVQSLYSKGHEMASHSLTHSHGEKFSVNTWKKEIDGQREVLHLYGGVKLEDVRGMRAPFLQVGGNNMFEMLFESNFTYDSSMPVLDNNPPFFPYTLDYSIAHECMIPPCPTKSFPGLWEVGMVMWNDYRGGRCSMGDACANPDNSEDVYKMLLKNFNRHYESNRAPFGLFYHAAWFTTQHFRKGYLKFIEYLNSKDDVYLITNWQAIQWMREPTPLSHIKSFRPWQCPKDPDRPGPCHHPKSCSISHKGSNRNMRTCQPCPSIYPWTGRTGFAEVYG